jgi:hypothetical protein
MLATVNRLDWVEQFLNSHFLESTNYLRVYFLPFIWKAGKVKKKVFLSIFFNQVVRSNYIRSKDFRSKDIQSKDIRSKDI